MTFGPTLKFGPSGMQIESLHFVHIFIIWKLHCYNV